MVRPRADHQWSRAGALAAAGAPPTLDLAAPAFPVARSSSRPRAEFEDSLGRHEDLVRSHLSALPLFARKDVGTALLKLPDGIDSCAGEIDARRARHRTRP
jgi:hypothetical protein